MSDSLFTRRVLSLGAGILCELVAGIVYSVGVWAAPLGVAAGWSPGVLANCKIALDIGLYIAPHLGYAVDRFSARVMLSVSAVLVTVGWASLAFCSSKSGACSPTIGYSVFFCIGQGSFIAFSAPVRANAENFGKHKTGVVSGALLAGFGISSAIFSSTYASFGGHPTHSFFIFLASFTLLSGSTGACFVCPVPKRETDGVLDTDLVAADCLKPVGDDIENATSEGEGLHTERRAVTTFAKLDDGPRVPPSALPRSIAFLLIYCILALSGGANIAFVQTINDRSRDAGDVDNPATLVTVFAFGNLLGRFGAGVAYDALKERHWPRAWLLFVSAVVMMGSAGLGLSHDSVGLWAAAVLAGLSEGMLFACFTPLTKEAFGYEHFGVNLSLVGTALGVGAGIAIALPNPLEWALVTCFTAACCSVGLIFSSRGESGSLWPVLVPLPSSLTHWSCFASI